MMFVDGISRAYFPHEQQTKKSVAGKMVLIFAVTLLLKDLVLHTVIPKEVPYNGTKLLR